MRTTPTENIPSGNYLSGISPNETLPITSNPNPIPKYTRGPLRALDQNSLSTNTMPHENYLPPHREPLPTSEHPKSHKKIARTVKINRDPSRRNLSTPGQSCKIAGSKRNEDVMEMDVDYPDMKITWMILFDIDVSLNCGGCFTSPPIAMKTFS